MHVRFFICFIDPTEAYDRVQFKDVLNIFEEKGIPKIYIKLIKKT